MADPVVVKQEPPEYHNSCDTECNTWRNEVKSKLTEIKLSIKKEDCDELPCECNTHHVLPSNESTPQIMCESDIKQEEVNQPYGNYRYNSMETDIDFQYDENISVRKQEIDRSEELTTSYHHPTSSTIATDNCSIEENLTGMYARASHFSHFFEFLCSPGFSWIDLTMLNYCEIFRCLK